MQFFVGYLDSRCRLFQFCQCHFYRYRLQYLSVCVNMCAFYQEKLKSKGSHRVQTNNEGTKQGHRKDTGGLNGHIYRPFLFFIATIILYRERNNSFYPQKIKRNNFFFYNSDCFNKKVSLTITSGLRAHINFSF